MCVLLCVAMFDIPSAYAFMRGAPWWLAMIAGLVVFPAVPLAWHITSERRRKRAEKPKPTKTKGIERFLFRTIAVAVLAIGGLVMVAGRDVWTAIKTDALWFVPTTIDPLAPDSTLFEQVPPSAQLVVWLRPTDDARAIVGRIAPAGRAPAITEVVAAVRERDRKAEVVVIERGDAIIPLIESASSMILAFTGEHGITMPAPGSVISDSHGVKTWSTPGWSKELGTGRAPVLELVRRAPEDAFLVAVGRVPAKSSPAEVTIVAFARAPRDRLEVDVTFETPDVATAIQLHDMWTLEIGKRTALAPRQMGCWRRHTDELSLRREGSTVRVRMAIEAAHIQSLLACAR